MKPAPFCIWPPTTWRPDMLLASGTGTAVGVLVGVGLGVVGVGEGVGVPVLVDVRVGVLVRVGMRVRVGVGVRVGASAPMVTLGAAVAEEVNEARSRIRPTARPRTAVREVEDMQIPPLR